MEDTLVVTDAASEKIHSSVIPIARCILQSKCNWDDNKSESAEQIAGCMYKHLDYSEFTGDEFEYALRLVYVLLTLKSQQGREIVNDTRNVDKK